ncbi:MAG: efflux RND transporter periplasmic adaptor subunit [Lentisphaeraceae bacterium]|nr:efflux RND transporter periplasmic adaptor subunit [Lentisphaeraceae bacterium]
MNLSGEVTEVRKFRGPATDFLKKLLLLQIRITGADAGAVIKVSDGKHYVLASSADYESEPEWLTAAAQQTPQSLRRNEPVFLTLGAGQKHSVCIIPFPDTTRGTATILTGSFKPDFYTRNSSYFYLAHGLLDNYEARMTLKQRQLAQKRIHNALDLNLTVNRKKRYKEFCTELCSELSSRWNCTRVSLGFAYKDRIRLEFINNIEKFSKKMKVVQDLQEAMDECADQDKELIFPPVESARYIYRQLEIFSRENDQVNVLTIPIHHGNRVQGVLLMERDLSDKFTQDDLETLRLAVDLISPRLLDLENYNGWIHRSFETVKRPVQLILGRENTLIKLITLLFITLFLYLTFATGDYNIEGTFRIKVIEEQTVSSPYEGILDKVNVKPGDTVTKGQVLAEMDTLDLELKAQEMESEILNLEKEYTIAVNERNTTKAQIAKAKIKGVQAGLKLTKEQISRGKIISPVAGTVLSEKDLTQLYRAPVKRGDELFLIGDTEQLEAIAYIPEDQIPELDEDDTGQIAVAGKPQEKIDVVIKQIAAAAEVKEQQNVFKVRMTVKNKPSWLKSGMEGLVKVKHSEERLIWIWSRKMINWIRMKLWI